jgi:hypothetical protein
LFKLFMLSAFSLLISLSWPCPAPASQNMCPQGSTARASPRLKSLVGWWGNEIRKSAFFLA